MATCNAGGAGKWRDEFARYFEGRAVCILPDNDGPGDAHANQVKQSLEAAAASVRIIHLPGLPAKGDVTDWIRAGGDKEKLEEILRQPEEEEQDPALPERSAIDDFRIDKDGILAFNWKTKKYERIAPPIEILAATSNFLDEDAGKLVWYLDRRRSYRIAVISHTKLIQDSNDALNEMVNGGFKPGRRRS